MKFPKTTIGQRTNFTQTAPIEDGGLRGVIAWSNEFDQATVK